MITKSVAMASGRSGRRRIGRAIAQRGERSLKHFVNADGLQATVIGTR